MEKKNYGNPLIKGILLILIIILVVFLIYEIIFVDVFRILHRREEKIVETEEQSNKNHSKKDNTENVDVMISIMGSNSVEDEQNHVILDLEPVTDSSQNDDQYIINLQGAKHYYYYNQLDDNAKIIYKGLEDNIANMESGNYKIEFGDKFNDLLNSEDGEQKLKVAFQSAWNAFTYDYVDIFYIDVSKLILQTKTTTIANFSTHKVSLSCGDNANYFTKQIDSTEDLKNKKEFIETVRKTIVKQLEGYSEYDQIRYLHNWMVEHFKYDTTSQKNDIHNVYGGLKNREVVCEGYARTFKYILDGLEIESVLVSGEATNSDGETESHAWNYIKLDGKWYAVDVTWDDPVITGGGTLTDKIKYKYFMKGSKEFFKNHKEDGLVSKNTIKFKFPVLEKENYIDA